MFESIAPRYDLLNHLLSLNLDRRWRRAAVAAVAPKAGERALDACSGTGDLSLALAAAGADVVALDFTRQMLMRSRVKAARAGVTLRHIEGDASLLPFAPSTFDLVTAAFGVRNIEDPRAGLRALAAMLAPGGRLAILEFSRPSGPIWGRMYLAYFRHVLPRLGALISGKDGPYSYLPQSVMTFIEPAEMIAILADAGLDGLHHRPLAGGAVALVTGSRA